MLSFVVIYGFKPVCQMVLTRKKMMKSNTLFNSCRINNLRCCLSLELMKFLRTFPHWSIEANHDQLVASLSRARLGKQRCPTPISNTGKQPTNANLADTQSQFSRFECYIRTPNKNCLTFFDFAITLRLLFQRPQQRNGIDINLGQFGHFIIYASSPRSPC